MTEQCRADSALTRDVVCLLTFQAQSAGLSLICCDAMQSKKHTRSVTHTNTRCKLCLRQNVGLHRSRGSLVSADLVWSVCTLLTSRTPEVLMHGYLLGRVLLGGGRWEGWGQLHNRAASVEGASKVFFPFCLRGLWWSEGIDTNSIPRT